MAQQFQNGEVRKLQVMLQHPLVLEEDERRARFGTIGHARIVDLIETQVLAGAASWDGVVFVDTVDGMEVADVIAVLSRRVNDLAPLSVDHAVKVIGRLYFDDATDDWVATPGFFDPNPLDELDDTVVMAPQ